MTSELPTKGTVFLHATRVDYDGKPLKLTVTSITNGKVYSRTDYYTKVKTPVALFSKYVKEIVSVPEPASPVSYPKFTDSQAEVLFAKAHAAGIAAGEAALPTPMIVVQRLNPFDDSSPIIKEYEPVMDGMCGFAYVTVKPGNSSFAKYLKKHKGAFKAYYGGTQFSVHQFGQSYERKTAYASAFVNVLTEAGIKAHVESRLD